MSRSKFVSRFWIVDILILIVVALILRWFESWSTFALGLFGFPAILFANWAMVEFSPNKVKYPDEEVAFGGLIASILGLLCFASTFLEGYLSLSYNHGDGIGEGLAMFFGMIGSAIVGLIGMFCLKYVFE